MVVAVVVAVVVVVVVVLRGTQSTDANSEKSPTGPYLFLIHRLL